MLEKILESPLESKEIKPVNPKGNQPWTFIGRTNAEAPTLWPPDGNSQLIGKDLDAGKDRRQKEKRVTEDEMVGWHHRCNGHELGQTPGAGEGQGSLGVLQSTRLQRVRRDLVTEHHTLTAKHFKQSYTRAKKSTNFIQPSSSHAVWSESFVCLIKCVNTLESTLWGKFLSFQKRRPKQTNQQKYIGGCYGAMPRAPRTVSAMVLMDLCHLPSLHQQPGHSSHPREPDPQSLLTAQLPGKRSEYPLTLKKATFPLNSWKTYHFFFYYFSNNHKEALWVCER